ncbi:hypothetical protein G6011_03631 [Alternaria panax]|uniref:Uncharacterized protein n=1 Tax=Alternaria panax TaxID=48097 RepID=A0AAD4NRD3_9PLEO|nr:hypothetical protein G6011_03631 [Alternaria panax]
MQTAARHLRAVRAEKRLEAEKNLHEITSDALELVIMKRMAEDAAGSAALLLRKRRLELSDNSGSPAKKPKHVTIVCIECYKSKTHKQCDGGSPCWPCKYLEKECKRMRCKYFVTGTCLVSNCTRANSDSSFSNESLVHSHHVA